MVDAADSKSADSDIVRVRVSPWAPLSEMYVGVDLQPDKSFKGS